MFTRDGLALEDIKKDNIPTMVKIVKGSTLISRQPRMILWKHSIEEMF